MVKFIENEARLSMTPLNGRKQIQSVIYSPLDQCTKVMVNNKHQIDYGFVDTLLFFSRIHKPATEYGLRLLNTAVDCDCWINRLARFYRVHNRRCAHVKNNNTNQISIWEAIERETEAQRGEKLY